MENKFLNLKSKVKLNCSLCDKCCQNRGDIKITPINVIEISQYLNISIEEFITNFTHKVEGSNLEIALNAQGDKNFCIFNNEGTYKCQIQKVKPVQCVVFPLVPVDINRDLFINTNQCPIETQKEITVNKWLNGNNNIYKKHKEVYLKWIDFLEEIDSNWNKIGIEKQNEINKIVFYKYKKNAKSKDVLNNLKEARLLIYKK